MIIEMQVGFGRLKVAGGNLLVSQSHKLPNKVPHLTTGFGCLLDHFPAL